MKKRTENNGSNVDDWATPDYILDWVRENYGEFYDPCPLGGINGDFDGLKIAWSGINYVNPPYSRPLKDKFIMKAYEEHKRGIKSILLIPASTDTKIFHEILVPNCKILFIKGRVKFKGTNTKGEYVTNACGQSGSMICIFGEKPGMATIEFS